MEKVDEFISELAEHITEIILSGNGLENETAEKTKALAELVSARANEPREIDIDYVIKEINKKLKQAENHH